MISTTQQQKAQQRRGRFSALLRDMFQLDQPELDFGLYRIMHARKNDINRFIEQDLPSIAQAAFQHFSGQDKAQLEQELEKAREAAAAAGFNPDDAPKVKELHEQIQHGFDLAREEGEVYDALITFFSRYYDEGDFISRRMYKDGTYAIPYQGEEVVLHWANKDQYYVKSSETLRDYTFRLNPNAVAGKDSLRVHFKLVDAEAGAKDNNKDADENKRVFVLDAEQPFEWIESESDAEGEGYQELQFRFYFRQATQADWIESVKSKATAAAQRKEPTQAHLLNITEELLLGEGSHLPEDWKKALSHAYRKTDGELADYSNLMGQLNNYTKKNTFDYFIHKDLGGFLTRELDFYIKNELMQWSDLAVLKNDPARLAPMLSKLDVIKNLGEKIIAFLAQLENFQKKLWLKKKFVTESNYCITLDRLEVHEGLLKQVFSNKNQLAEWEELYKIDLEQLRQDCELLAWSELLGKAEYRYMMVDTAHFTAEFKAELLATIEDLDEQCDGLLVHSENFQALNLLRNRYKERVKCVYIDPPYNTAGSEIIYKNEYKHSSWLSLISNRLEQSNDFLVENSIVCVAIDDAEAPYLTQLLSRHYGEKNYLATVPIRSKPQGRAVASGFSPNHEYAIFFGASGKSNVGRIPRDERRLQRYKERDEKGIFAWSNLRGTGANSWRTNRPKLFYKIFVDGDGQIYVPDYLWSERENSWVTSDVLEQLTPVLPLDEEGVERVWTLGWERAKEEKDDLLEAKKVNGEWQVYRKYRPNQDGALPGTWWDDPKYSASESGTKVLKSLFSGIQEFSYPKSINTVIDCLRASSLDESDYVIDYFSGSGTTGHAVINLNREDNGHRKYILVEMGNHFDAVLKPRLVKVAYAKEWKNGKPVSRDTGISHCIKYIRLESYEDTLGNLVLQRRGQQKMFDTAETDEARQAYLMNYMLDVETRGSQSLLNTQQFLDPTQYQLNVRSASGDETVPVNVDLLETFNYLLGLEVEHIAAPLYFNAELNQGEYGRWQAKVTRNQEGKWWFRTAYGKNRNGQKILIVWRNLPSVIEGVDNALQVDNAVLDAVLIGQLQIRLTESLSDEIDILYVNGDHNIHMPRDRKGEPMEQTRIQLIEEAFHRLMFADTESTH